MISKKIGIAAASLATGAVIGVGVLTSGVMAQAETPSPTPSSSASASSKSTPDGSKGERKGRGGHQHTEATADEAAKVTAAVKAKDSAVTVDKVLKDPDGSFDVEATKGTTKLRYEVSADLKTIDVREARVPGTPVTGDELAKVTAAVKAKDSAVTVESVTKGSDGSYRVRATKDDKPIGFKVSSDLKTVEERAGREPGGKGGRGGHEHTAATAEETAQVTAAVKAKDATITVENVVKDPDGSFDVRGTKDGASVHVEVSQDLKTVKVRTGR